ncbi:23S rRNA (uracil(1939)-C(5))-methyltransferase RlmD [Butyrivibrio sp. NC3005]|uniref:23S rRNA (uracil(1939)-C(5))-methyltransferase RlmD n=1 Tax=Butyrivibrio sp. NC3005 TaxID=1280685 RepID=UPI000425EE67|nr:23S rRNA (uracil(1939)-C(5))-methyltransferase RlmD [Butyrivibrio sp. NC3005]
MEKNNKSFYKKGDIVEVEITDIGNDGEGIGKVNGYTLFVKDAVIGDKVSTSIMKAKKNYAYAHLDRVVTSSQVRVDPKCKVSRQCGGCQIQGMKYESQLEFKSNKVKNNLIRIGNFKEEEITKVIKPIIGMDNPYHYRNKAQFPIGQNKEKNPIAGFYAGRTHCIIENLECYLGTNENKDILQIILSYMKNNKVLPYDEVSGNGLVRHVLIRKGFVSGQIMVCLVINYKGKAQNSVFFKNQEELIDGLRKIDGMSSISVSINTEKTNVILGTEIHTLWGESAIEDTLCGLTFKISPLSFYQVNPVQCEKLYNKAIEYAALSKLKADGETAPIIWDLYCGIGTISLSMAKYLQDNAGKFGKTGHVYGVEIVPQAIEDAKDNAKRNGIMNADFFVGKAEEVLPQKYEEGIKADVIVIDPPRKGCDQKALDTMLDMQPNRIVYVSCDSATLARDLRILVDGGYRIEEVTPVDMFPHTVHVETVVLLSKLHEAKSYVDVEVKMDELDLTKAESKATYDEIKEWVREVYDFNVTYLNIAQIKRKNGIIERDCYNKPKSDSSRQPNCTKEKEEAITAALKHFKMI